MRLMVLKLTRYYTQVKPSHPTLRNLDPHPYIQ